MKILFLAPQPFFQERGTPINVALMLGVLSQRGDEVDVLTYHEGEPVDIERVHIFRIPNIPFVTNIRPGLSWKKLVCDLFLCWKALQYASRNRCEVVHAVEESVFIAMLLKRVLGIPYVFDMDSSMVNQITDQRRLLKPLKGALRKCERAAVRGSAGVLAVCDALGDLAAGYGANHVRVLRDISILSVGKQERNGSLRKECGVRGTFLLYVGNLERYQGADLMLDAFSKVIRKGTEATLVIVGGSDDHIKKYGKSVQRLGLTKYVRLVGRRPVQYLRSYLEDADILISPRITGGNTPLKIYSYLESGTPVLATDLDTHTQVLNAGVAYLSAPTPDSFSEGMFRLINDAKLRAKLGRAGKALAQEKHIYPSFKLGLNLFYEELQSRWLRTKGERAEVRLP